MPEYVFMRFNNQL